MSTNPILLYIDPGTGSMLFTILLGLVGTTMFFFKKLWLKLKFRLSGGKGDNASDVNLPYVIFSDNKTYWNTFKPICDEFESRGIDISYWTASPDDHALKEKYEHVTCEFIGEGNKAFAKLNTMHADICLSTTPGLDVYQWKRSKHVKKYVHIMHSAATTLLYRMFGIDYYDTLLLTGDFQVEEIRELEAVRKDTAKELKVVGCVYLDALKKKLDTSTVSNKTSTNILLAPSWGEAAILHLYGERIIDALIKTGYCITIRPHPQSLRSEKEMIDRLMKRFPPNNTLEWNFDSDNFESLHKADLMITDFSAVILDFALVFDKPVIYTEYNLDKSVYDAAWIDHPLWQETVFPKLGAPLREDDLPRLKSLIDEVIANNEYIAGREQARNEAWMHIGNSAALTVDYLLDCLPRE